MPVSCQLPEHAARRKGACSACGECRFCPLRTPECEAIHIGKVNPAKKSKANKRKRRKSGGTPQRDISRTILLNKLRAVTAQLSGGDDSIPQEVTAVRKILLEELEQAAATIIQQLVGLIMDVSDWEDAAVEEKDVLRRVVGGLSVSQEAETTIAESDTLVTNMTSLALSGTTTTKRYVMAIMCESLGFRRCREVLSSLAGTDDAANQLGKFAFGSRRADFKMLKSAMDLETRLSYVRLKKDDLMNALTFIQNNCDLSWRNGHVVSRVIGTVKVQLPRLKRHLTMGFLFGEYVRWGADQALGTIGRHEFYSLLRFITIEVQEVTGASYYFTDGVIESFKIIKELLTRLRAIVNSNDVIAVESLITRSAALQYFVKYDLKSHLDANYEGSTEGFHCVRHAVNGACEHEHRWTCESCLAVDQIGDEIVHHIAAIQDGYEAHSDELKSMVSCTKRASGQIHRYVKHAARAVWQHARIAGAMISVTRNPAMRNSVLFVDLDHKQKVLGRKLVENQIEYFGKVGMSLLGAMVMTPASPATEVLAAANDAASVALRFFDMVVNNGAQDSFQGISCLEALILHLHDHYPLVDRLVLISDNASVFCGGDWIPWVIKLTRRYPFLRVSRYMNSEAQTSRDMLDAHFSFLNRLVDGFVRKDNAVQTGEQLFAALTDGDGVANTTTLHIKIDDTKAQLYNSNKRTFNTKVKTEVRKVHDIVYDDACAAVSSGSTPLVRIFTNSGVPNSVMTTTLANMEGLPARMPKYVCPDSFAEQIVASVVEKTLASKPHCDDDSSSPGSTLTGVMVLASFTSPKEAPLRKSLTQVLASEHSTEDATVSNDSDPVTRCLQRPYRARQG